MRREDLDPKIRDTFCAAPFSQLLLQPNGAISPCCWNQTVVFGDVTKDSFEEIWNGEVAQNIREEFLSGNIQACYDQVRHIGCHKYFDRFIDAQGLTMIQKKAPNRFDIRLNGQCNLECVMCDVWSQPNGLYDNSFFWNQGPKEIFPKLREIDVLGGEPFVQSDTYKLIDIISEVNPDCSWAFVTNAHYRFTKGIKSRLDKVKIRWFQVSIDSVHNESYARLRKKGDLNIVLKTLEELLEYRKERLSKTSGEDLINNEFRFIISMCIQKLNWSEMREFYDFCVKKNVQPVFQFAYDPDDCSLLDEPLEKRLEILDYIKNTFEGVAEDVYNPIYLPLRDSIPIEEKHELEMPSL